MDGLIIFAAKYLIILPLLIVAYVGYEIKGKKLRKQFIITLLITGAVSLLVAKLLKSVVDNPRPFITDGITPLFYASGDNGFPSDHTLLSAFLAFSVWQYRKNLGLAILALAVLIGWTRVAAGVHHGVDIIASLVITAAVCFTLGPLIRSKLMAKNTTES